MTSINKKILLIVVILIILIIGGEMLLPVLEEIGILTFEWAEKTLDLFFEVAFDLTPESSQRAAAWTGLFIIIGLLIWGGFALRKWYLRAKVAVPQWLTNRESDLKTWWTNLSLLSKVTLVAVGLILIGILPLLI